MSDEEIRALDRDLEQSRNAFLRAREAQRRLNLNTRDVNRMGANESRPDSITPGVIHTHDVIRLGANESQPDSIITHDVNSNTHDVNRSGAQSRLDSNTHDVNRPEAQSRQNSNTHDVTRPGAQSRTNLDMQDVPPAPAAARVDESALLSPTTELNTLLAKDRRMRENGSPPPVTKTTEHDKMEPEVQIRRKTWTCEVGCGFRHPDFETVAEHEKTCSGKRPMHEESPAAMEVYNRWRRELEANPKTFFIKDRMVREDDLAIDAGLPPPFGGSRSELCYSPGELRAPELTAVPHCTTSHPPVTPPPQKRDRPLLPSSYHPMGSGLADHELAAVGTGGSESNRVSRAAVGTVASPHASPSTTCTPELLPHHKMPHPPVTPLSQESGQPLPPSSDQTMGGGLADHEPAAAGTGGSEFSHVSENAVGEAASSHTSPSTTCTPDLVSHHKMPHPPVTPLSQESGQPLPPSSDQTMGGGLADHEPAAAGTGGSEFSHVSENAVGEAASSHTSPSTTCTPDLVSLHKMSHPPATPLSQDSGQPLSPSTHNTMGDGLVDHEPAVAEVGGSESSHTSEDEIEEFEPWDVSHPPANPPSQESDQLLPPSSYNTMGGGLAEHEPAVAATGGSEFRDASKDASKDESEPLTSSQKKRIKRKASKAKRDAEVSQRSGVHTRFPEDGVDQTSVLPVSVNAVS